jgi:alanine racemase
VDGPLLIMGALSPDEVAIAARADADVVAWREDFAAALPRELRVHVKLDTGMGRLGTRDPDEASRVVHALGDRCAGLMTHFATADEDDPAFLDAQLAEFTTWIARHPGLRVHAANSAAAIRRPDARFDLVRCGIAIYGLDPFHHDPADHGLEPALELLSYVAEVKRCEAGQSAGYGRRFVAERPTWLGTIPIGYGDGVRRALTNNAEVLIDGRRFPVVGTVSMDNITVDLGDDPPGRGAEVVLIGRGILAEDWARRLATINYEITCGISARVPREHV